MKYCIVLALCALITGCGGGGSSNVPEVPPPTAEQLAIQDYVRIASNANIVLSTDRINWVPGSTAPVRVSVECKGLFCSVGYTLFVRANKVFRLLPEETQVLPDTNGINTGVEHVVANSIELHSYAGWMEHSFFASTAVLFKQEIDPDRGTVQAYGTVNGFTTNTNPEVEATWTGFVTARDQGVASDLESVVTGDASISVSIGEQVLADVYLSGMSNAATAQAYTDLSYEAMVVTDGQFSRYHADDNHLSGTFFGPNHEEVSGVFEHPQGLLGAYGGTRR